MTIASTHDSPHSYHSYPPPPGIGRLNAQRTQLARHIHRAAGHCRRAGTDCLFDIPAATGFGGWPHQRATSDAAGHYQRPAAMARVQRFVARRRRASVSGQRRRSVRFGCEQRWRWRWRCGRNARADVEFGFRKCACFEDGQSGGVSRNHLITEHHPHLRTLSASSTPKSSASHPTRSSSYCWPTMLRMGRATPSTRYPTATYFRYRTRTKPCGRRSCSTFCGHRPAERRRRRRRRRTLRRELRSCTRTMCITSHASSTIWCVV